MSGDPPRVAIACQGGGSHTAFTAGALATLLVDHDEEYEIVGLSGASGGAINATAAWYGMLVDDEDPTELLQGIWRDLSASDPGDAAANWWTRLGSSLEASGAPLARVSPYLNPFADMGQQYLADVLADHLDFERFPAIAGEGAPKLSVGTVNVSAGTFETFEDGDVTVDALLASGALPDTFEAVEIDGHAHWDGLFSQNPPVRDLLHVDTDRKPEELWIVQINPQAVGAAPRSSREIADRRNELSGNISLNQQLRFVEQVNAWLADGMLPAEHFQHVDVHRITMGDDHHAASKVDRSPAFIDELIDRGVAAAADFREDWAG